MANLINSQSIVDVIVIEMDVVQANVIYYKQTPTNLLNHSDTSYPTGMR
jgi:hypothetical protein